MFHSPDHAKEAAEARRLAVLDTLSLENSVAHSRTLAYLAQVALKALEVGEFEARLEALEKAVIPRLQTGVGSDERKTSALGQALPRSHGQGADHSGPPGVEAG